MIDCQQCRQHLEEAALGEDTALEPSVRQHLDACRNCRQVLNELREAWALLPLTLEPAEVSQALSRRVMDRVEKSAGRPPTTRQFSGKILQYAVAAAILIALVTPVLVWTYRQSMVRQLVRQRAARVHQHLDQLDELQRGFGHPAMHFVSLQAVARAGQAHAYLLHDMLAEQGHFYAFGLPQPPDHQCYKLWILTTNDQVLAATVLDVDSAGAASASVSIPGQHSEADLTLLVTAETEPDAAAPSGDIRLDSAAR